jgi:hypothetical protein
MSVKPITAKNYIISFEWQYLEEVRELVPLDLVLGLRYMRARL